jgi:hypothetical protein
MAARYKAWATFARPNTGIVVSNPTRDMDVCVNLFRVCVVLWRADLPAKESYRLCID